MGFKDKLVQHYTDAYFKKYGDRLTQVQGSVVSAKVEEKRILWIFHKLTATLIVRPQGTKNVTKCVYQKNKWFKKPEFIVVTQGHSVIIQGLKAKKGKESRDSIEVMNIRNLTTKRDLVPVDTPMKQQVKRVRYK
ncbi:MAG: hypothetical protein MR639_07945 [Clostridium sp.]|uniref:hypothetical protein n=1 Tax=Clostridium sp. TaxID=1506 RepID=UPI002A884714|nr:hypothetical protein [Clostridium sp.]MDY5097853.1 hypothetical protein [Clostridium sp.]